MQRWGGKCVCVALAPSPDARSRKRAGEGGVPGQAGPRGYRGGIGESRAEWRNARAGRLGTALVLLCSKVGVQGRGLPDSLAALRIEGRAGGGTSQLW